MPSAARNSRSWPGHGMPRISTSPEVGVSRPSRISMVVVLPAPFGPEQTEALAGQDVEIQSADRLDLSVVGLLQIVAADGNFHIRA